MAHYRRQTEFAISLLRSLGVQPTHGALKGVVAWENAEGGNWNNSARFNPLNTTRRMHGSSTINGAGVRSYGSWGQGLRATERTLRDPAYEGVLRALAVGRPRRVARAVGRSPWGTSTDLILSALPSARVRGSAPLMRAYRASLALQPEVTPPQPDTELVRRLLGRS